MLVVYIDDIIVIENDEKEIGRLKVRLSKEFEVKDPNNLSAFLGLRLLMK
jgi:hypothetical protein